MHLIPHILATGVVVPSRRQEVCRDRACGSPRTRPPDGRCPPDCQMKDGFKRGARWQENAAATQFFHHRVCQAVGLRQRLRGRHQPACERSHVLRCKRTYNAILKQRAEMAGLEPGEFSAHGFRSSYLTEATNRGILLPEAMEQSRHRSVQQASNYYSCATRHSGRAARLLSLLIFRLV